MPRDRFPDRQTAGRLLAELLQQRRFDCPIVLAVSLGGIVVAAEVAAALDAEMGAVVSRKLVAPYQSELILGAVTADGMTYVDASVAQEVGANRHYLLDEQSRQAKAARRQQSELDGRRPYPVEGRDVLVVDQGLTTGATAIAVVRWSKSAGAARVVVAAPVGPPDTIEKLERHADEVVCLRETSEFLSVSQFYEDFPSIDTAQGRDLLLSHRTRRLADA